jgi:hypothetical protein
MENQVGGSELRIEKKDFGYRIIIDGESYFVKNDDKDGWFRLITENENGEIKDVTSDKYENLGVSNLDELIYRLLRNPSETLEMLLGEKKNVGSIVIKF